MKTIYKNEDFEFVLYTKDVSGQTQARIIRHSFKGPEEDVLVFTAAATSEVLMSAAGTHRM